MASRTALAVIALLGTAHFALGRGGGRGKGDDDECLETGYEVWQNQFDEEDIGMRIDSTVDSETCTYEIKMTFDGSKMDEVGVPFMNDVTYDNFHTEYNVVSNGRSGYATTCVGEGLLSEFAPGEPKPWGFPIGHVGVNAFYTDFGWTVEVPKKTREATGFEHVTLGASPCGTWTQQFPHYSVHFYTVTTDFRETIKCTSDGGFFCHNAVDQCGESGIKFNMDGADLPRCEDGTFANTFQCDADPPFQWTVDDNPNIPGNAGTPGMGLHGTCPSEFFGKDEHDPFLLMVQYDRNVISNHAVFWSGFATGEGLGSASGFGNEFAWDLVYNCLDEDHRNLPTRMVVEYDEETGLTTSTIMGPALSCDKDISETTSKGGKKSKGKSSSQDEGGKKSKGKSSSQDEYDLAYGMTRGGTDLRDEGGRIAQCANQEEPAVFKTSGELGEAQKVLMTLAEDLVNLSEAVKDHVLMQTEEMAIGLDDVEAIDEGRADRNDPSIKQELDGIEGEYKEHGGKVLNDLKTIKNIASCIEKGMEGVMNPIERRHK